MNEGCVLCVSICVSISGYKHVQTLATQENVAVQARRILFETTAVAAWRSLEPFFEGSDRFYIFHFYVAPRPYPAADPNFVQQPFQLPRLIVRFAAVKQNQIKPLNCNLTLGITPILPISNKSLHHVPFIIKKVAISHGSGKKTKQLISVECTLKMIKVQIMGKDFA